MSQDCKSAYKSCVDQVTIWPSNMVASDVYCVSFVHPVV